MIKTPKLPDEINIENWNNNKYYFQSSYFEWKPPYSARKYAEQYFKSLAYITWIKLYPEIYDWTLKYGGWDNIKDEYKNEIYTSIMMNIEFLRNNKVIEQNMVRTLTINNFNSQTSPNQWYSDKQILGENCLGHLTKLGILRIGLY